MYRESGQRRAAQGAEGRKKGDRTGHQVTKVCRNGKGGD